MIKSRDNQNIIPICEPRSNPQPRDLYGKMSMKRVFPKIKNGNKIRDTYAPADTYKLRCASGRGY